MGRRCPGLAAVPALQPRCQPRRCTRTLTELRPAARVARLVPGSKNHHGGRRLLTMLAIAVLVLGLPRLLRTCDHGDHRHFVVAFETCAHGSGHDLPAAVAGTHAADDDRDERTPPVRHDERQGTSSGNAFALGTPPRPFEPPFAACAPVAPRTPWLPPAAHRQPSPPPPATGPPRPDDRPARRRTTPLPV